MTYDAYFKRVNEKRLAGGWYTFIAEVEGKKVQLKGYKTWLQIFRVDGVNYPCPMEQKVAKFKELLASPFKETLEARDAGKHDDVGR